MFYTRPPIAPLGWDLIDLPTPSPDSLKHFDGLTSDRRPIDFEFSGGWLTVYRGPVDGVPGGPDIETVLSLRISPFGTMDIEPEQLCDILGITVNGITIDSARMPIRARGFDWSGLTTYWQSTHHMESSDDPRIFLQQLRNAFPDSILFQPEWGSHAKARCRRIEFLMNSDEIATLGVGPRSPFVERLLSGEPLHWDDVECAFLFHIEFSWLVQPWEGMTGDQHARAAGSKELALKYDVLHHRRYRIRAQFLTDDPEGQDNAMKMISVIDDYFCRGLQAVDLRTGAVIEENMADELDETSYSKRLRDRCVEKPNKYLFVGVTGIGPDTKVDGIPVFYGARPIAPRS